MITLAKEGIFPIIKDKDGRLLSDPPATGFDFPGTVQGEGKWVGTPSLFIRMAGCNLHCAWRTDSGIISECDTAHAAYRIKDSFQISADDICAIVRQNTENIEHIVITGGEPFMYINNLKELCYKLKLEGIYYITVETNATIFDEYTAGYIDFFSMSPKLASSVPPAPYAQKHNSLRINIASIQSFINHARENEKEFQIKFVYASENDIPEIHSILSQLEDWFDEDIILMPLGNSAKEIRKYAPKALEHCIRNGWRYGDRLHFSLFGNAQGV